VFGWSRSRSKRKQIRDDRKYLEARARRLLRNYLSADGPRKQRYYEVVAGAAAACRSDVSDPRFENTQLAQDAAEAALNVVKMRERQQLDVDNVQSMITDAYATVAIAHRRAAAAYADEKEMQQLGTAAVHLVTMATSYMEKITPSET
jgi:dihydropteroate synthase